MTVSRKIFDEKKFYKYLENVQEKRDVIHSVNSLKRMDIPVSLANEVVQKVEKLLRKDSYWKPTMKLIRKLEDKVKYPDSRDYAPNLKDSKKMVRRLRKARLQRMEELEWIEREMNKEGFRIQHERNGSNEYENGNMESANGVSGKSKKKKKHKKRTRRKYYSKSI